MAIIATGGTHGLSASSLPESFAKLRSLSAAARASSEDGNGVVRNLPPPVV
jgi:hypothetical protein